MHLLPLFSGCGLRLGFLEEVVSSKRCFPSRQTAVLVLHNEPSDAQVPDQTYMEREGPYVKGQIGSPRQGREKRIYPSHMAVIQPSRRRHPRQMDFGAHARPAPGYLWSQNRNWKGVPRHPENMEDHERPRGISLLPHNRY